MGLGKSGHCVSEGGGGGAAVAGLGLGLGVGGGAGTGRRACGGAVGSVGSAGSVRCLYRRGVLSSVCVWWGAASMMSDQPPFDDSTWFVASILFLIF